MRLPAYLYAIFLFSNAAMANILVDNLPDFNIKQANQTFDRINLQLSTQNLNQPDLNVAINTLGRHTAQAELCMNMSQKRLASINALIQQSANSHDKNTTGADQIYLDNEKKKLAHRQSQCRLYSIRANEAIDAYKTTIAHLTQAETLARGMPLWSIITQLSAAQSEDVFCGLSEIKLPKVLQSPSLWIALGCIALMMSIMLILKMRKSQFSSHYLRFKKPAISHVLLLSACLIAGSVFVYLFILLQDLTIPNLLLDISQQLFLYFSASMFIVFLFKIKRVEKFFQLHAVDCIFFRKALLFSLCFYTLATIGHILAGSLHLNDLLLQLGHSLFLLAMLITGIYFVYYFCRTHRHIKVIKQHKYFIHRLGTLLLLVCIVITILGYDTLATHLSSSALSTFVIVFVTGLIIHGINKFYFLLSHHEKIKAKIIACFGYKPDQSFTEFLILKTTLQVIVIALSLFLIVRSWGLATWYLENAYTQLLYGIHFANTTVYPTRIVMGVVVYCLLYLLFRSLCSGINRHEQFKNEEETQVAIASIFTYLGFAVALISALLVAGFNFTGLAIVAGALSVGIGLGLQSIVNNFVSGLILLIEKPIKPGDLINIDGIDGFVKKIRVRSTHIITPAFEDVIVPNSDLITKRVTNYVYSNKQLSITCDINVPLGSDAKCVRSLLLQAANEHEDVIKVGLNKPYVLFRSFGEKALNFQVCCLINDVNKKLLIQSDLNFAIDLLLRENNI